MRHAGQVLTRTMIFEAVRGRRFDPGTVTDFAGFSPFSMSLHPFHIVRRPGS